MSVIKLSIFPAKAWICRKKTERCALRVPKSSPGRISKFCYENVAKSKLQNSPHPIVAKQAKPKLSQLKSNKFKYQIFSNSEFRHWQMREIIKLQNEKQFKQGLSILSYS